MKNLLFKASSFLLLITSISTIISDDLNKTADEIEQLSRDNTWQNEALSNVQEQEQETQEAPMQNAPYNSNEEKIKYVNKLRREPLKKRLERALDATEDCDHKKLDKVLESFDGSIRSDIEQILILKAIECLDNPKMVSVLAKHRIPLDSPIFPQQPLLVVALESAENGNIIFLQKMLKYGADPLYENQNNNERLGSTLSLFEKITKQNRDKFPHASSIYALLEKKALEKTPWIAEETKKAWAEIWSKL